MRTCSLLHTGHLCMACPPTLFLKAMTRARASCARSTAPCPDGVARGASAAHNPAAAASEMTTMGLRRGAPLVRQVSAAAAILATLARYTARVAPAMEAHAASAAAAHTQDPLAACSTRHPRMRSGCAGAAGKPFSSGGPVYKHAMML
jgi:hypothetical protein